MFQKLLRLIRLKVRMIRINVIINDNRWHRHIKNLNNYIDRKVNKLNSKSITKTKNLFTCSLLLTDKKEIKYFNKKFRNKDRATDVLSFPFNKKKDFKKILKNNKEIYLGDMIINLDHVRSKKSSKDFKTNFDQLWIHGLIHLFGYDHIKDSDYEKMSKVEKKYLGIINVKKVSK